MRAPITFALAASIVFVCQARAASSAPAFPTKPITIVVPLTAGGPVDILARLVAEKMAAEFKLPVIVENKPGGGGNIGAEQVARARPDGYTVLCSTDTPMTVNPFLYKRLTFSAERDLTPVSLAATFAQMLVVNPTLPAATLEQFMTLAKQRPVTFASGGNGSPGHLTGMYFADKAGIPLTHVPYKGNSQAVGALLGGQVDAGFLATPGVLPHIKAGKLKAIAVSSANRSPLSPDTPTFSEASLPGFEAMFAMLYMAPAGTPPEVVDILNRAIDRALRADDVRARLAALDIAPGGGSTAQASAYLARYRALWGGMAAKLNLQVD